MERLEYKIDISAPAKTVWETMLEKQTYEQWTARSWPSSTYKGKWGKGEEISFVGTDGSGTHAELTVFEPYKRVLAKQIALLGPGGVKDSTSEVAKKWVGTTEEYQFSEHNGTTTLAVVIEVAKEWSDMFNEGWPIALEELKKITEQKFATA